MKTYFIADPHFGHKNVINLSRRPFEDIDQMDKAIIQNWNARVTDEDTVYILGDFIYKSKNSPQGYLNQLLGKKHLIIGNHDSKWMKQLDLEQFFESVSHYKEITEDEKWLILCHYPMLEWNGYFRGSFMIHGHVHNNDVAGGDAYKDMPHLLNAGVDVNHFMPVTFEELIANNQIYKGNPVLKSDVFQPNQRMSEALVKEKLVNIVSYFNRVDGGDICIVSYGYEDYTENHWETEWIEAYRDPEGLGVEMNKAAGFAFACIDDMRYEEALDILNRLLNIRVGIIADKDEGCIEEYVDWDMDGVEEVTLGFESLIDEDIIRIDVEQMLLSVLYCTFQTQSVSERVTGIYIYLASSLFRDVSLIKMRNIGTVPLQEEEVFWKVWIDFLLDKSGELETRLLKEAVLFVLGADGLAEVARKNYDRHPALYLAAIKEYGLNKYYQKIADLGADAMNTLKSSCDVKVEIALRTSFAEYQLGNVKNRNILWFEAYKLDKNEVNYLRLFSDVVVAEQFGVKAKTLSRHHVMRNGRARSGSYAFSWYSLIDLREICENNLDFLAGDFAKVYQACENTNNSLGWSGKYIGHGIKLFLMYLYTADGLDKGIERIVQDVRYNFGYARNAQFGFDYDDVHDKSDDIELFWNVFSNWKKYFSISTEDEEKYLDWIEKTVVQRTTAIVGGKYRNHYEVVAELIAAIGEVKESRGQVGAKRAIMEKYEKQFPRHSSFRSKMNRLI
ncbi:MAG: metallophosphoesterase [Lachnospiraceae bacterium]|nr:metallophosphoesterase [Lachnospiraceae bacterium]